MNLIRALTFGLFCLAMVSCGSKNHDVTFDASSPIQVGSQVKLQGSGGEPSYRFQIIAMPEACGKSAEVSESGELIAPPKQCTFKIRVEDATMNVNTDCDKCVKELSVLN